jgi:predicted type IV restriction endonuclease
MGGSGNWGELKSMEFCDMASAPKEVIDLIEQFERNIESFKGQGYSEAQVRQQFINPFFEALGWDMQNKAGIAPAYSDVIHEDAIKVGGTTKAPDYCFRVGGTRKFFLEAKKPSIDIKSDISPAYQLRRYAWSAKLPLSILTDFEEFAVYDCQVRPGPDDKPSTGRIMLFTYKDYADKWEQIANIFSKEAVYKGLFDKYASEKTTKRGTTTVDKEFLAEIEQWRNELAKNIAIRNGKLSVYDLNFAVQKTIDRILFLRICEDRGIERSEQLLGLINGSRIYPRLFELFEKSDERYNSGIFHFHREKDRPEGPDELSANLKIDDDVLTRILKDLYYPRSPYEFSVMPAEILGQVYEQFLGKVIRLTESHQAKVEEKPEVKKAGGVYYTPAYIVDYIVKNTVGKLLGCPCEERSDEAISNKLKTKHSTLKTPAQVAHLRILDPACGSGSFLIGAYQYLLDFHRDYYAKEPAKHKKVLYQGKGKQWFLTIDEKKKILLNNIYGVDIDSQAAEVTKLSLLLKVLENETQESLRLFHERALPDLGNNIKCGNSLIGPDFYQKQQLNLFGDEQQRKINAFDWQKEFAPIFKQGGFDAVIGNPPYVDSEWMTQFLAKERNYCTSHYRSASGNWDIFCVFIEKALELCKPNGYSGMIVPNKLGSAPYASATRSILTINNQLILLRDYSHVPVFPVAVYPIVYVVRRISPKSAKSANYERMQISETSQIICGESHELEYSRYFSEPDQPWQIFSAIGGSNLIDRLRSYPSLDTIAEVVGAATVSEAYEIKSLIREHSRGTSADLMLINSGTIDRYHSLWGLKPCRYIKDAYLRPIIPINSEKNLPPKRLKQAKSPKIIVAGMTKQLECTVDLNGTFLAGKSTCLIFPSTDLRYLLGLMNSKLLAFYYRAIYGGIALAGGYLRIGSPQLRTLPVPNIDFTKPNNKAKHNKIVSLVEQMLELNKKLAGIKNPDEKTRIQRQIDATDAQIDKLVYDLYGLTPEEVAIVEGN